MTSELHALEVHEHSYISGPNSHWPGDRSHLVHSHSGGDQPHEHMDQVHRTGPSSYTIDRDEWDRLTGLRGGGRKRYTTSPSGVQLPMISIEPPQPAKVVHLGVVRAVLAQIPNADLSYAVKLATTSGRETRSA